MKITSALLIFLAAVALALAGCDDGTEGDSDGGMDGGDDDTGANPDCPNGILDDDVIIEEQGDFAIMEGHTDVGGYFQLSCEGCTSIESLDCMEMVFDATVIVYNHQLTDLSGLETLKETNESVQISTNDGLTSLSGLGGLEYVGGPLFVTFNESLTSLDGLDSLTQVNGYLQITDNPNLGYCEVCDLIDQVDADFATTVAYENKLDSCWDTDYNELWCY